MLIFGHAYFCFIFLNKYASFLFFKTIKCFFSGLLFFLNPGPIDHYNIIFLLNNLKYKNHTTTT